MPLELTQVSRSFGGLTAVKSVDPRVESGEVVDA
jgi:hypothetical protein